MNKMHTRKEIENAIVYWGNKLFESKMASEEELAELLDEGLLRSLGTGFKNLGSKVKTGFKNVGNNIKDYWKDIWNPNEGVKQFLDACKKLKDDGKLNNSVYLTAQVGDKTYPICGFALSKTKTCLILVLNKIANLSKTKTLKNLQKFLVDNKFNNDQFKSRVDSIKFAFAPEEVLSEGKNISTKPTAKSDDKQKTPAKAPSKKSSRKTSKKPTSTTDNGDKAVEALAAKYGLEVSDVEKALTEFKTNKEKTNKKPEETKSDADTEPISNKKHTKPNDSSGKKDDENSEKQNNDDAKQYDRKAVKLGDGKFKKTELVAPGTDGIKTDGIKFVFDKSKAEIELDKKLASVLSLG